MSEYCIIWFWKPIGYNLLECINYIKENCNMKLLNTIDYRISFSCRLDPMACGILPIVIANKKYISNITKNLQDSFKVYRFSMIKGVKTDSHDILGMVINSDKEKILTIDEVSKKEMQSYPVYSSKTVKDPKDGKMRKLFEYAKENRLDEILNQIPSHPIEIKYIKEINKETKTGKELLEYINNSIDQLRGGDFRIEEIRDNWRRCLQPVRNYEILSFEAKVSSGTYIRGLVDDMGGTAFNICRVEICDKYSSKEIIRESLEIMKIDFKLLE